MKLFSEYKHELRASNVMLNPPLSDTYLPLVPSTGMPDYVLGLYAEFNGMEEAEVDPRNQLHISSVQSSNDLKVHLLETSDTDEFHDLFILGHVMVHSFYIALGKNHDDGVYYISGSKPEKAFQDFEAFFFQICRGSY